MDTVRRQAVDTAVDSAAYSAADSAWVAMAKKMAVERLVESFAKLNMLQMLSLLVLQTQQQ